jgi:Fur family transcriptional regulator, ferric uptake regulator
MTKARKAVLATLDQAREPLSAADVVDRVHGACDQATVYRALHYLENSGFAESFVLSCSEHGVERYYASRNAPHRHWFHCESCHRFIDLGLCRIGGLVTQLEEDHSLKVSRHTLYLTGTCRDCAETEKRL